MEVNIKLNNQDRLAITALTSVVPTGINRVSVNVSGYLMLKNFNPDVDKFKQETQPDLTRASGSAMPNNHIHGTDDSRLPIVNIP